MMIALPRSAPPTTSSDRAVDCVNSSMLARVPGPAERAEMLETISAYGTRVTLAIAATTGTVAWAPHVTRLTSGASRCAPRLTAGITGGPVAAGVRSTERIPRSARIRACSGCAWAEVASNARSTSPVCSRRPSRPVLEIAMPARAALASPGESGSMPATPASSSAGLRPTLAIRSVPMLPEPMMITRNGSSTCGRPFAAAVEPRETERLEQLRLGAGRDELGHRPAGRGRERHALHRVARRDVEVRVRHAVEEGQAVGRDRPHAGPGLLDLAVLPGLERSPGGDRDVPDPAMVQARVQAAELHRPADAHL